MHLIFDELPELQRVRSRKRRIAQPQPTASGERSAPRCEPSGVHAGIRPVHIYQVELVPALYELGLLFKDASSEKTDGILTMNEIYRLSFTVLSDHHNQIASGLTAVTDRSDAVWGIHA